MTTLRIADRIAFELRLLGLIGAFQYDTHHISFMASVSLTKKIKIQNLHFISTYHSH